MPGSSTPPAGPHCSQLGPQVVAADRVLLRSCAAPERSDGPDPEDGNESGGAREQQNENPYPYMGTVHGKCLAVLVQRREGATCAGAGREVVEIVDVDFDLAGV